MRQYAQGRVHVICGYKVNIKYIQIIKEAAGNVIFTDEVQVARGKAY